MSSQGPAKQIDLLADVLIKLSRNRTVTAEEAKAAISEHNKLTAEYQTYKTFYQNNQSSYSSQLNRMEEARKSVNDRQNETDPMSGGPNAFKKLKEDLKKLAFEKENLEKQVSELRNRLSLVTGQKITGDNPDIADLSDPHRPTQLAEKFRQIYDDEWTHAFEELEDKHTYDEFKIIDFLGNIIKNIDTFCGDFSKEQIKQIQTKTLDCITNPMLNTDRGVLTGKNPSELDRKQTDLISKMISDIRKSFATLSVGPLIQIFDRQYMTKLRTSMKLRITSTCTNSFVAKAVEVIWLMKVQKPPMVLVWQKESEIYDKDKFSFYTKRGEYVKQTVWPAVQLHSNGPLMSKGVLQAK